MEDEFFGKVFLGPPDDPPDTGVNEPILVPAHVYALHQRQPEVPLQLRVNERSDETSACRVHVDRRVPSSQNN